MRARPARDGILRQQVRSLVSWYHGHRAGRRCVAGVRTRRYRVSSKETDADTPGTFARCTPVVQAAPNESTLQDPGESSPDALRQQPMVPQFSRLLGHGSKEAACKTAHINIAAQPPICERGESHCPSLPLSTYITRTPPPLSLLPPLRDTVCLHFFCRLARVTRWSSSSA